MADLHAVQDHCALLESVNLVAVEIRRAIFELGEVFDASQRALRSVYLLVEHPAQARRVQTKTTFLRAIVGIEMELPGRVAIHMAVKTGHTQ